MRFISLFAGIGGIDLGLERAGHECVGQVEIDEHCTKVLEKHWPDVPRWRDIRELTGAELPEADLWTAGFPCQDLSNAGKREGIRGQKSGIFFGLMRLVRKVRPQCLLLENVPGLLVRGMGAVLGELAESGYDAEWDCIPAAAVGAPHIRYRVFILAYPQHLRQLQPQGGQQDQWRRTGDGSTDVADAEVRRRDDAQPAHARGDRAGADGCGPGTPLSPRGCGGVGAISHAFISGLEVWKEQERLWQCAATVGSGQWSVEPDVGRVAHGIPSRVDRLRCLGNAVVPQVGEYIGRLLTGKEPTDGQ